MSLRPETWTHTPVSSLMSTSMSVHIHYSENTHTLLWLGVAFIISTIMLHNNTTEGARQLLPQNFYINTLSMALTNVYAASCAYMSMIYVHMRWAKLEYIVSWSISWIRYSMYTYRTLIHWFGFQHTEQLDAMNRQYQREEGKCYERQSLTMLHNIHNFELPLLNVMHICVFSARCRPVTPRCRVPSPARRCPWSGCRRQSRLRTYWCVISVWNPMMTRAMRPSSWHVITPSAMLVSASLLRPHQPP